MNSLHADGSKKQIGQLKLLKDIKHNNTCQIFEMLGPQMSLE